jgi:hypothetical protein
MADSKRDLNRCELTSKVGWRLYSAQQEVGLELGRYDFLERNALYVNNTAAVMQQDCARHLTSSQFLPIAV